MVGVIEAYLVAVTAFTAMALYGVRTGAVRRIVPRIEMWARYSIMALLGSIGIAFLDVARQQDDLIWRQWLVWATVGFVAYCYAKLLWRDSSRRHRKETR